MKKKGILFWVLFLGIMFLGGCQTAKGVAVGIGTTVQGTAQGAAKDSASLWQGILKLDAWMKDNLW